jgi:hypothetical protein
LVIFVREKIINWAIAHLSPSAINLDNHHMLWLNMDREGLMLGKKCHFLGTIWHVVLSRDITRNRMDQEGGMSTIVHTNYEYNHHDGWEMHVEKVIGISEMRNINYMIHGAGISQVVVRA